MKKIIKKINLKKFPYKWKKIITVFTTILILIGIGTQLIIFYSEKINPKDLKYEFIQWSEYCDGRVYSQEEKETFCNACLNKTGKCEWPLDMNISIGKLKRTLNTKGEIHCFFKIDNINYYTEKGSYYGITETPLFTWQILDSTKNHILEFCCGIDRQSVIATLFHLEKNIEQGCITSYVQPRCINETI